MNARKKEIKREREKRWMEEECMREKVRTKERVCAEADEKESA